MSKVEELSKVINEKIETVLSERFARYSKYIIQERALPDVRDGLKPVQRRILYSMYKEKNLSDKHYRKSAKTVGNVIGNYHPHGDSSVYEAMVRMSQEWKVRELLVDMHGNNGSIDNDPPAAMRYTEARLSKIAEELLRDIDKYTVDFALNFDDTESEPTVLPSRYPNILVNGSQGISAGYATDIPPHNLDEVISATIYRLKHPLCSLDEIMNIITGPDFPTGGIVQGVDGIKSAYETGRGKIVIRSKYYIDEKKNQIIVTEIPYEVNKANLLKKMEDIHLSKTLEGLEEARDESDKEGLRIVIDYKKDANKELIINYLLKNTELKINFNFNMVVIHNKRPKLLGVISILDSYIEHQKEVIINRSNYELTKSRKRLHILEGLVTMVSILDQVIYVIRHSQNKANAKENIIKQFKFTEEQAEAIVSLQLYRLTTTDIDILEEEARRLTVYTNELLEILNFEKKLVHVLIKELDEIRKQYASPRLTEIQRDVEEIQIDQQKMIKSEDVVLNITKQGFIRTFKSKNNGNTIEINSITAKDYVIVNMLVNTLNKVLLFTNKGNYILLSVHQIDIVKSSDFKQHINDLVRIEPNEHIVKVIVINEFSKDKLIIIATKQGFIKRTPLIEFETSRNNKSYTAVSFKNTDDELVNAFLSDDKDREVLVITKGGYINKYTESQVPATKLKSSGVKSINLKQGDEVVSFNYIYDESLDVLLLTQRGNMKKIKHNEISFSVRTNRGQMTLKSLKKNSHKYIGAALLSTNEQFIVEKENDFMVIKNDLNSYSDIVSNGKLYDQFNGQEIFKKLIEITSVSTNKFSPKEAKIDNQSTPKNENLNYKQLELFK